MQNKASDQNLHLQKHVTVARSTCVRTHPRQPQHSHYFKYFFFSSGRGNMEESMLFLENQKENFPMPNFWCDSLLF